MQKQILLGLLYLLCWQSFTQNKPVLYDFAEISQSQLLNPALDFNNKKHVGIPFLSGLHAEVGLKNFSLFDFFGANSTSFSQKIIDLTNRLLPRDFLTVNGQLDVINIGFRLKNKSYLSFGFYQETDLVLFFPRDPLSIFLEGNTINRLYNLSDLNFKLDVLGVFHIGISKKINENVGLGFRLKLYNSLFQAQTRNNTGTFITTEGVNSLLLHRFSDINLNLETSGFSIENSPENGSDNYSLENSLANNLGLGLDFGIVNQITPQLKLSASILDFGFVSNSKKVQSYALKGNFTFDGLETDFTSNGGTSPWEDTKRELRENLPFEENTESYISLRPIKINAALKYGFGKYKSKLCYDNTYKNEYANAIGAQFFSVFRPLGPQMALTGFYERMITRNFKTKITYTLDSYSFSNVGIGASTRIGKVNFYGTIGNLIQFIDISKSNHFIAQMGINYIVN